MNIILATTSPHRKKFFADLGIPFSTEASNVEEKFDGRPNSPEELVKHLAGLKCEAVAQRHYGEEAIVIGFDSVGYFNGEVLEKPQSREEAFNRLRALSGKSHEFYTGIYVMNTKSRKTISSSVKTIVTLRILEDDEINLYLDQDPTFRTYALGYDPIGHYSTTFIADLHGSYNNILKGIPLEKIVEMLKEVGYNGMKIYIVGSMHFSKEMIETQKKLREMGHLASIPPDTHDCRNNPHLKLNEDLEHCEKIDIMRACTDLQEDCDAIIVLNYPKEGVEGYIGANTLMEMGLAYYLKQKIFLLYPPPSPEKARYYVEVMHMKPIILNGDLNKLKDFSAQSKTPKITICGSSSFRKEMVDAKNKLACLGCEAVVHKDYEDIVAGNKPELLDAIETDHADAKIEYGWIKWYYNSIINSDAILVLNYDKKGIKNYIGGNTLMEMGFAYTNNKKIFLMNPIPTELSYSEEIEAMQPIILNSDLSRIYLSDKFEESP